MGIFQSNDPIGIIMADVIPDQRRIGGLNNYPVIILPYSVPDNLGIAAFNLQYPFFG